MLSRLKTIAEVIDNCCRDGRNSKLDLEHNRYCTLLNCAQNDYCPYQGEFKDFKCNSGRYSTEKHYECKK